jgi:hypothetical protein
VAAVLAQMDRDPVGAGGLRGERRLDGIRILDAARLTERRDVVDVDAQPDRHALLAHGGRGRTETASRRLRDRLGVRPDVGLALSLDHDT